MKWLAATGLALVLWLSAVATWIAVGPVEDPERRAEAAIVLGAAVTGDRPSPVFAARIDHAIDLYHEERVDRIVMTGARSAEDAVSESAAGRAYAMTAGVPREAIHIEEVSQTTLGNLREARKVMRREGITSALLVSDPLHLRRAMAMAHSLNIDAKPSPTPHTRYRSWRTQAPFLLRETYFLHHFWIFGQ